ncbi:MAG: hypothetical protein PHF84_11585, partial [bacterium]|nr:hypothetical protein [bacterium]
KWFQIMAVGRQSVYYFTFGQDIRLFSIDSKAALGILNRTEIMEKEPLKLPENAFILKLVRRTSSLIFRGLKKKDLKPVYSVMDPDFKKEWSLDSFCARFRDYWEKKDITASLVSRDPVFEYPPAIDLNNKLSISVYYRAKERELHLFELYSYRNRKWTLFNLVPSIRDS